MKNILLIFGFSVLLFIPPVCNAQSLSISLRPTVNKIISKPGKTIKLIYTVGNVADPSTVRIVPYILKPGTNSHNLLPVTDSEGGDSPQLELVTGSNDDSTFLMVAKEERAFALIISIPEKAKEKDFYFSVVAESVHSGSFETGSKVELVGAVASNIYISVSKNGVIDNEVEVALFGIHPTFLLNIFGHKTAVVDSFKEIPIELILVNKGKNMAKFRGSVESGMKKSDMLEIAPSYIFAKSQKSVFSDQQTLPGRLFGAYTVTSKIEVNDTNVIYSTSSFVVFPFKYFSISSIIFLGILFLTFNKHKYPLRV